MSSTGSPSTHLERRARRACCIDIIVLAAIYAGLATTVAPMFNELAHLDVSSAFAMLLAAASVICENVWVVPAGALVVVALAGKGRLSLAPLHVAKWMLMAGIASLVPVIYVIFVTMTMG